MAEGTRFNPPPGWLVPPGFTPQAGWQPDPAWPPAPAGWPFWLTGPAGNGLATGVPGLLLGLLGLILVIILQVIVYDAVRNAITYSAGLLAAERILSWIAGAVLLAGTVLGAIGARKPRGGRVAVAALIVCGVSAALCAIPVY